MYTQLICINCGAVNADIQPKADQSNFVCGKCGLATLERTQAPQASGSNRDSEPNKVRIALLLATIGTLLGVIDGVIGNLVGGCLLSVFFILLISSLLDL